MKKLILLIIIIIMGTVIFSTIACDPLPLLKEMEEIVSGVARWDKAKFDEGVWGPM